MQDVETASIFNSRWFFVLFTYFRLGESTLESARLGLDKTIYLMNLLLRGFESSWDGLP